jgi:hypothetical protein
MSWNRNASLSAKQLRALSELQSGERKGALAGRAYMHHCWDEKVEKSQERKEERGERREARAASDDCKAILMKQVTQFSLAN